MDLENASFAPALGKKQHYGRVLSVRIDARQKLAVNRPSHLVFRRDDQPARGEEFPRANRLWNDAVQLGLPKIVEVPLRLAPCSEPGGRTEQEAEEQLAPLELGLGETPDDWFHDRPLGCRRTNRGVAAWSMAKTVSSATA